MVQATRFTNGEVRLHPPWREALARFLAKDFHANEVVPFEWFYDAFGMVEPSPGMAKQAADKIELVFLEQFTELRKRLLEDHQIDLVNERGYGYRITPPEKQTRLAYEEGIHEARKAMRKMRTRIVNVNTAMLTADQKREQVDALAKLSMLQEFVSRQRRLPSPE